ncbi:MAG: DMT family transporter [Alphaproteobacteria bacterium]
MFQPSLLSRLSRARAAAGRLPATTRGALWMTASAGFFAGLTGMIRYASEGLHPFEVAFFRSLFGLLFMAPWLMRVGVRQLRTARLRLYSVRGITGMVAMLTWFYALSIMDLTAAVALSFTAPLFATAGAALVLGERVGPRRWSATAVGFLGTMLILRPGPGTFEPAAILVLVSAAALAATVLMVKELSRTEQVNAIVIYTVIYMTPLTLVPALFVWRTPTPEQLLWLAALAAIATLGNLSVTRALAATEASAVLPFDFVRLPFVALIGFVAFDQVPDAWTWVGAGVVAVSSLYIAHREARLERARRSRDAGGTDHGGVPPSPGQRGGGWRRRP